MDVLDSVAQYVYHPPRFLTNFLREGGGAMKLKTVSAAITLIVATLLVGTKTVNSASGSIEGTINVAGWYPAKTS